MSEGQAASADSTPRGDDAGVIAPDQSDTISRTLVLAQRTADSLIAEARAEAAKLVSTANDEAAHTRDSTREMAAAMVEEARDEARRASESERVLAASEVDALKARRDFLESDVDHLEQFLIAQRGRVRDAATELIEITDRVPAGLGDVRRPLLSASDDDAADDRGGDRAAPTTGGGTADLDETQAIDLVIVTEIDGEQAEVTDEPGDERAPLFSTDDAGGDDATPVGAGFDRLHDTAPAEATDDDFRFTFDDDRKR